MGGLAVDFRLNHNSQSSRNGELGPKWATSYDVSLTIDSTGTYFTVFWGDGRAYTFTKGSGYAFTSPPGIHDTFALDNNSGCYVLTTKDQVSYRFGDFISSTHYQVSYIYDKDFYGVSLAYNSSNTLKSLVDTNGRSLTFSYDASNRLTLIVDPLSRQWSLSYDGSGNLAAVYWPMLNGGISHIALGYDVNHNITSYQDLKGNTSTFAYNSSGSTIAWEKDNVGNQTSFQYGVDANGATNAMDTTIVDPNGHKTVHTYNASGQLASVTDALGYMESYSYDGGNNTIQQKDRNGQYWNYTYDGMGNVLTAKDPYSNTTTYTYNARNEPLTQTWPSGRSVANTYSNDGVADLTQVQQKDAAGNVLSTTRYTIGSYGLVSDKYDPNNHHTTYTYDSNGNLASTTTPLGNKTQWTYDALGFKASRTDAMSRTTTYTPDAWERLSKTAYPDGTTRTFSYDADSNLTGSAASGGVAIARTYDADNRQIGETEGGTRTLTKTYDAAGQLGLLSTTTDFLGTVHSFAYTARNQIYQTALPYQPASYTYDPNGNQTLVVNPNGTQSKQVYDNAGRVTGVTDYNSSGGVLFSASYAYNADSQKASGSETNGAALSWGYDALGHLTSEVRSGGIASENISYGYDPAGNRTSQGGSFLNGTFSYNADDELTAFTGSGTSYAAATFGYDADGERTSETTNISPSSSGYGSTFGYDFEGNLTGITASGNGSVAFAYDGLDRQLGWQSNGSRLDYQLDGDVPLTETNSTTSRVNLWGNGLVMSAGETPVPDGLGATRGTTNSGQGVVWAASYTAFGYPLTASGSTISAYQWGEGSSYRSDGFGPTGAPALTKVGARFYDPAFGCFLTRDTLLTEKPYLYCNDDPINFSDPTGHKKRAGINWTDVGHAVVLGAVGGLGAAVGTAVGGPVGGIVGGAAGAGLGEIIWQCCF